MASDRQDIRHIKYILLAIAAVMVCFCGGMFYALQFGSSLSSAAHHVDSSFTKIDALSASLRRLADDGRIDGVVEKMDALLSSPLFSVLSNEWTITALLALMERGGELFVKLNAIDLEAIGDLTNADTVRRIRHIVYATDKTLSTLERQPDTLRVDDLLDALAHLRNFTNSLQHITDNLQHSGIVINLGP